MADYDAIVIGSGAGGLSASLKLARSNFKTLLLEAMPNFGGYLNPFRRNGYTFDTGLHYLGELAEGEPFRSLLEDLGIADLLEFNELNPDAIDRYIFPDHEFRLCKGKEGFMAQLIREFPNEERGILKFFKILDKVRKAMEASASMKGGILEMLRFLSKHPLMLKYSRAPYQKLLDEVTSDRRLQAALAAISIDYGLPPARASAIIALAVLAHFFKGGYYPRGGSGAIRDAFVAELQKHGAELKNRSRAISIDRRGNDFVVATESNEEYTARAVISDADPVITLGSLVNPELVSSRIKKKIRRLRPSAGAFYVFIGTDLDLPSLGVTDANIIHYNSYDINKIYEDLLVPGPAKDFGVFFITSPSVKDPGGGHAPEGRHNIEIITACGYGPFEKWAEFPSMKRGEEYTKLKEGIGQRLVAAAERYIPGLSQHLDCVEYATPLSNQYWVNAVRGGMYGPEQTPDQIGPGRFVDGTTGIDGLFLAGAGAIGCGIASCIASGVRAAARAADYLES